MRRDYVVSVIVGVVIKFETHGLIRCRNEFTDQLVDGTLVCVMGTKPFSQGIKAPSAIYMLSDGGRGGYTPIWFCPFCGKAIRFQPGVSCFFRENGMGMSGIRRTRNVPAKRGGRVTYIGRGDGTAIRGMIRSAKNSYPRIQMDGELFVGSYHPTWKLEYDDAKR